MPACFSMLLSRAYWYISNRMWHSDPSRLHRMLELLVAAAMRDFVPAILIQTLDDFPAGHKTRYTLSTHLSSRVYRSSAPIAKNQPSEFFHGSVPTENLDSRSLQAGAQRRSKRKVPKIICSTRIKASDRRKQAWIGTNF